MDDDETTGTALLDRITATEPPVRLSAVAVRRAAQDALARRRRKAATAGAAAVAVVAIGGLGIGLQALGDDHGSGPLPSDQATFSPDALVESMQRSVDRAQADSTTSAETTWTLETVLATAGDTSTPLTGADRAGADFWHVRFTDGEDHLLEVNLSYGGDYGPDTSLSNFNGAEHGCSVELAQHFSDVCRVSQAEGPTSDSGRTITYKQRDAYLMGNQGWPTPHDPLLPRPIPKSKYWYIQHLTSHTDRGLTVSVIEAVMSPDGPAAASQFTLSEPELTEVATDPALTFPEPAGRERPSPGPDQGSSADSEGSPSATPPSTVTSADGGRQAMLLDQLAASLAVRRYLLDRTDLPGMVLCGLNTMGEAPGEEPGTRDLYVWVECGAYRTGPAAQSLTGGADPAILTVRDNSGRPRIERVEFPPPHYTFDQLTEMFPPDVVEMLRSGALPVSPTAAERLATAASAG